VRDRFENAKESLVMKEEDDKPQKKSVITVVVNGKSTQIEANDNAPLQSIVGKALANTGNTGQEKESWELRDEGGNCLDLSKKIEEFGFPEGVTLFLNVKAGVGGGYGLH
jgi:hypothetical protein